MTNHVRMTVSVLMASAIATLLTGCSGFGSDKAGGKAARKAVVLTLANPLGDSEEFGAFTRKVSRLSAGRLRIDVRSNWRDGQIAFENGLIGDVRAGKADLGVVGSRAWDSVGVLGFRALAAPFLIDSYALEERVVRSPMIPTMLRGLRPLGLVGLGVVPGPLRRPLGIARPLVARSDYARLRIGVQQSRVASATMRALGAKPVWFGRGSGVAGLGGIEQQTSSIQGNRYDRIGKYLTTNVVFWPRPLVVFANRKAYEALTPEQRNILLRAATADVGRETASQRGADRESATILCRAGRVRFFAASSRDLATLRRAVAPVYAQLERDPGTRGYLHRIEALRAEAGSGVDAVAGCNDVARTRGSRRTPIDGVWHMVTRIGDEPADPQPVAENYGDWIFVFDRGRFAFTQEYRNACTWGYGRFTVHGHETAWTFTDGGGISPNGAANKPGEFFRFGWSLYRDTLSLAPVRGAISPLNLRDKPWRLIGSTPSARFLSKRCPPPARALPR